MTNTDTKLPFKEMETKHKPFNSHHLTSIEDPYSTAMTINKLSLIHLCYTNVGEGITMSTLKYAKLQHRNWCAADILTLSSC